MKKILYFSITSLSLLTVSCKKDYTCSCVYTSTQTATDEDGEDFMAPTYGVTNSANSFRAKKKDAKAQCEGGNGDIVQTSNSGGIIMTQKVNTKCELK